MSFWCALGAGSRLSPTTCLSSSLMARRLHLRVILISSVSIFNSVCD